MPNLNIGAMNYSVSIPLMCLSNLANLLRMPRFQIGKQVREKALHLWTGLACMRRITRQGQRGRPERKGFEMHLERQVD